MPLRALVTTLKTGGLFLSATWWSVLEIEFIPPPGKMALLFAAIMADLFTGLLKSWKLGIKTNSQGLKRTAIKIGMYAAIMIAVWLLANIMDDISPITVSYGFMVTLTVGFLTFIEIYSIFENIYEADKESFLSVYLIGPALKWMKGTAEEYNPFKRLGDKDKNR